MLHIARINLNFALGKNNKKGTAKIQTSPVVLLIVALIWSIKIQHLKISDLRSLKCQQSTHLKEKKHEHLCQ